MSIDRNWSRSATWDAGRLGCGGLILGLRRALDPLRGGDLLALQAHDAGACVDVPAWCRLTGHELVRAAHPYYLIQKKGD
jgi:TusA-related sulfurtransferase